MRNRPDRLRALNVPQQAVVEFDTHGTPTKIKMLNGDMREMMTIESVRETWRIDDEWWRKPITRTYYEVLLKGGSRMVVFMDLVTREWFVQKP